MAKAAENMAKHAIERSVKETESSFDLSDRLIFCAIVPLRGLGRPTFDNFPIPERANAPNVLGHGASARG